MRVAFRDVPAELIRQAGLAFSQTILPSVMRPHALERIRWHRCQGDTVVVVSGSLDWYLAPWCDLQKIDLLCSQLEVIDGLLTGEYLGAQCVGAEKVRRIRKRYRLEDFAVIYAYGDTSDDREMLALAGRKYFRWNEIVAR
jgi:phosphatidylglycerophosphatase C